MQRQLEPVCEPDWIRRPLQAMVEKHRPDWRTRLSLQERQRPSGRQVPPPEEVWPQFRGQVGTCGDTVEAGWVGSASDPVGDPVGQLLQTAGHTPERCGHSASRVVAVITLHGLSTSNHVLPTHHQWGQVPEPTGRAASTLGNMQAYYVQHADLA